MTKREAIVVIIVMAFMSLTVAYALYCMNNPIEDTQCECALDYNK